MCREMREDRRGKKSCISAVTQTETDTHKRALRASRTDPKREQTERERQSWIVSE